MTTATAERAPSRWLPFGVPDGAVRLYCLPHAGGSASAYRQWCGRLGRVAVCPVQPPGRETRLGDAPYESVAAHVAELADAVLAGGPGPYAVYGHSLGAIIGFELLREIRRRGGPDPVHLIVSGSPAPQGIDPDEDGLRIDDLDDAQVAAFLRDLGGTPGWMLSDPAVLRMILPPFRADFRLKEDYDYQPEPALDVPITALSSTMDPRASTEAVAGWRDQTTGGFETHCMPGGHFAVLERPGLTHRYIAQALRPWV